MTIRATGKFDPSLTDLTFLDKLWQQAYKFELPVCPHVTLSNETPLQVADAEACLGRISCNCRPFACTDAVVVGDSSHALLAWCNAGASS
jgi:hypothetical protein